MARMVYKKGGCLVFQMQKKRLKLEADEKDDGYYAKTADANEEAGAGSMVVF